MHPETKIVQIEFAEIFARDGKRIEIVFLEVATKFSPAFLVFSPNETRGEKKGRSDDRCDDVDSDVALQGRNHVSRV